jgi:hypothetical protein
LWSNSFHAEDCTVIAIVSGLPRSGTSLMMQMLAAGGMQVLTDGERIADPDNPRGYYEWERIKRLPQEPQGIVEAEGKVVKVISQLLLALPSDRDYRIIFMLRPLPEVVASQAEMIRRRGTIGATLGKAALIAAIQAHLNQVSAWLDRLSRAKVYRIDYHAVLHQPREAAQAIQRFLDLALDTEAMVRQVDLSLYRQHAGPSALPMS